MENHTYLITGGTTGIGLATARLLSAEGAKIIVTGRNPETLASAHAALPAGTVVLKSDAASIAETQALGAELQKLGVTRIDGAFLNAGVAMFGPIEAMTPRLYDTMFNVNVRGLFFQLQSLLPLLANPSAVLFNASVVAELGLPGTTVYSASKAAVVSLGKSLAVELAPRGIRVNTLSPGPIKTPIYNKLGLPSEAQKGFEESMAAQSLFKRFGEPDEVAKLARFLLSAQSSYIVGENITIDGGVRLT
jgi:NAD(P)-dependent dehydrogenase (short-subunit alcohol dehydrogenase family)